MKKSINRWAFDPSLSVAQCVSMAKRHGFDGIELNLEEAGDFDLATTKAEVRQIRIFCEQNRLAISSLCSLLFWKYPITSGDPIVREKGITTIQKMIDHANELGVGVILVVPGLVHADPPLDFGNPPVKYGDAYSRAISILRELAAYARTKNVTIGLENVYFNKFLITPMEYRRFLEDLHEENVRLYLDLGNTMMCGFPEDWIEHCAGHICQIHVKDWDTNAHSLYGWRNIFEGHINWAKVAEALKQIRYDGYIVGEPALSPYRFHPEELIKTTSSSLERLREMFQS